MLDVNSWTYIYGLCLVKQSLNTCKLIAYNPMVFNIIGYIHRPHHHTHASLMQNDDPWLLACICLLGQATFRVNYMSPETYPIHQNMLYVSGLWPDLRVV